VIARLAPALALTALLALAGCGGGSSRPTKAQYIAKVNAICATERQQLTQLALAKTKLTETLDRANAAREQIIAQIEAVKTPSREAITPEWLELRKRALSLAKRISAAGLGSRTSQPLNREYVVVSNKTEKLGLAYGLSSCRGFANV
jgi:hypothetical protein